MGWWQRDLGEEFWDLGVMDCETKNILIRLTLKREGQALTKREGNKEDIARERPNRECR